MRNPGSFRLWGFRVHVNRQVPRTNCRPKIGNMVKIAFTQRALEGPTGRFRLGPRKESCWYWSEETFCQLFFCNRRRLHHLARRSIRRVKMENRQKNESWIKFLFLRFVSKPTTFLVNKNLTRLTVLLRFSEDQNSSLENPACVWVRLPVPPILNIKAPPTCWTLASRDLQREYRRNGQADSFTCRIF